MVDKSRFVTCSRCKGTGIEPDVPNKVCEKCSGLKKIDWVQNARGYALTREEKVTLYVIKTLNKLVDAGILEGQAFIISKQAEEAIKNFKPTSEELKEAVLAFKREGYIQ